VSMTGCVGSYVFDPMVNNNEAAANRSAKSVIDATTWQQEYLAAQGCPTGYEDTGSRINRNTRIDNDSRLKTGGRTPLFTTPEREYRIDDQVRSRTRCEKI